MIVDLLGWIGSVMVVVAYAMNIYKKLSSDALPYYLLNIVGSTLLIINTIYHHAIPSAFVNVVWVLIAVVALLKKKKDPSEKKDPPGRHA